MENRLSSRRGFLLAMARQAADGIAESVARASEELKAAGRAGAESAGVPLSPIAIEPAACYAHQGQPCDYCVTKCPLKSAAIRQDARGRPEVQDGCDGCGRCIELCPTGAIKRTSPRSAGVSPA